jgi:predicted DNA-binding transcriptional regulator YafY
VAGVARDQAERVLNLIALLTENAQPLTFTQIRGALGANNYADGESGRATFERDKALVRDMGVPIEMKTLGGNQAGESSYRIDRRQLELSSVNFTNEERHALQLALAAVHIDAAWADRARLKLGLEVAEGETLSQAHLPVNSVALPVVTEAAQSAKEISFSYRGETRRLHPYGVLGRGGYWYVVGADQIRNAIRSFRVDRIEGKVKIVDVTFERPQGFDIQAAVATDTEMLGEGAEPTMAHVLIDAALVPSVLREFGNQSVIENRDDGSVVVEVPCGNEGPFRSWLLGLVEHAEVLSPSDVRAGIKDWLQNMQKGGAQ